MSAPLPQESPTKQAMTTYTCKPHAPTLCPRIHKLALSKPLRADHLTHAQKPPLVPDPELTHPPLRTDTLRGEMAQQRPGHVAGVLPAGAEGHGPVAVAVARLMCDYLAAVELEDGAGRTLPALRVVERRHALLDGQRARAQRRRVFLAGERRRRAGRENAHIGATVESVGGRRV